MDKLEYHNHIADNDHHKRYHISYNDRVQRVELGQSEAEKLERV